jgi:hypothetical protein
MHKLTPVLVSRVKRYECLEDVLVANERQWEKIGTTFFVLQIIRFAKNRVLFRPTWVLKPVRSKSYSILGNYLLHYIFIKVLEWVRVKLKFTGSHSFKSFLKNTEQLGLFKHKKCAKSETFAQLYNNTSVSGDIHTVPNLITFCSKSRLWVAKNL